MYSNNGQADIAYGITTGSDGNVYMTGVADSFDFFIAQYTSDSVGWLLSRPGLFDGPPVLPVHLRGDSSGRGVTVGSDGHIYVTGRSESYLGSDNGESDAFVSQFTDDGIHNWTQILEFSGGNSITIARSITTGNDGSIYITGSTASGYLDGQPTTDIFITKYTSSGSQVWTQLLGSIGNNSATSITMASDGSIYITGTTNGNLDGYTNNGLTDAFIAKYNSDGTKAWTQLFGYRVCHCR